MKIRNNSSLGFLILFFILSIGIGYGYLSSQLNLSINVVVRKYEFSRYLYDEIVEHNKENGFRVLDNHSSKYVSSSTGIRLNYSASITNGQGVYIRSGTEDDKYPIYYYRGDIANNNVIFGDFCWLIVRTTETGGIKLVYNGTPNAGVCNKTGADTLIGESMFNSSDDNNAYVGYMYGTPGSSTYEEEHLSTKESTSSTLKTYIDEWYSENMTTYTNYLEDAIWCNDRSFASDNTGTGAGSSLTTYTNDLYTFECVNQNDRFTVNEIMEGRVNGNGALTYPVATLTYEEIVVGYSYLHNNQFWWTLTPIEYDGAARFSVKNYSTSFANVVATRLFGVRPAVSLLHGTKIEEDGDGSANNPFVVVYRRKPITIVGNDDIITDMKMNNGIIGATINLLSVSGEYKVKSFKMNGELIEGNSFIMPDENVTITDIIVMPKGIITIEGNDDIITDLPSALPGATITLSSISGNNVIMSFKMNGNLINGNSFTMPEGDVIITEITTVVSVVIESEHNPYPNSLNNVVYGEKTFEGATSLTVVLEYQTESTSFDWIYLYDSASSTTPVNNKKYGGNTRTTETITINGNYIKIVFRTDGSGNGYYGFKATITPNY